MRFTDIIKMSLTTIVAFKQRSILTILGILVGIASVVLLTSIGEGVRVFVLSEFTQFGTNLVAVTPGKATTFGVSGATISTVRPLTLDDAEALAKLEHVIEAVPVVQHAQRPRASTGRRLAHAPVAHRVRRARF